MQASLPHRTGCRPLIIHLAPNASADQLSLRSATQNRTKASRRQSTQCQCPCNVPPCPSREHVHNMASPRSSHHGSMSNDTSMLAMRFAGAPRRVATCRRGRFARARPRTPSPAACPVSIGPATKAEHVHLLVATRLVAEPFEQQRQLKPVLPSSRGRRRAVRTRHQRICDIHATFHTRGRRRRTNDIANAPFWCTVCRYHSVTQEKELEGVRRLTGR